VIWVWGGFLLFIFLVLALDLGVLNRKAHVVSVKEALTFTVAVVAIATLFGVFVYFAYEHHWLGLGQHVDRVDGVVNDGRLAAVKFFTGYIIEVSLSADNVFVIAMIFEHLRVPPKFQHRVLFWGILGALAMRGTMIGLGAQLVTRYHWILYLFGVFLVYTALKMLWSKTDEATDPDEAVVMRIVKRVLPVCENYRESHFLIRDGGLMFYGPDDDDSFDRVAALVDRILKGSKPQDLPFEQPKLFKFVINAKTIKALGLEIPASIRVMADEVIE